MDRQSGQPWRVCAGAVVLATGGCAFGERMLGAATLTGDGYLMAAEAGAALSGMEFSSQYATAPKPSALNKGLPFAWASFYREDGTRLETEGRRPLSVVAEALLEGPVYAQYDKAWPELQKWLREGQPNCFLPLDRSFRRSLRGALAGHAALRGDRARRRRHQARRGGLRDRRARALCRRRRGEPRAPDRRDQRRRRSQFVLGDRVRQLGRAGRRFICPAGPYGIPTAPPSRSGAPGCGRAQNCAMIFAPDELVQVVREEMLPLDRNYFRPAPVHGDVAGTVGCGLVGAELASARRGRGSGKGARSRRR